jgi:hypothetical protein
MSTIAITAMVRGGAERIVNVDAADVVGSWDDRFLPLLAAALGLSGPEEIASVVIRDEDGEEDLVDGTRARKSARKVVAGFGKLDRLVVEVGRSLKLWLDPALEHDTHARDMR